MLLTIHLYARVSHSGDVTYEDNVVGRVEKKGRLWVAVLPEGAPAQKPSLQKDAVLTLLHYLGHLPKGFSPRTHVTCSPLTLNPTDPQP